MFSLYAPTAHTQLIRPSSQVIVKPYYRPLYYPTSTISILTSRGTVSKMNVCKDWWNAIYRQASCDVRSGLYNVGRDGVSHFFFAASRTSASFFWLAKQRRKQLVKYRTAGNTNPAPRRHVPNSCFARILAASASFLAIRPPLSRTVLVFCVNEAG